MKEIFVGDASENSVYPLKIALGGIRPTVWRRVLVPAGITFLELHDVIQAAMGWENCHVFQFHFSSACVSILADTQAAAERLPQLPRIDAGQNTVDKLLLAERECRYDYDFDCGDNWVHKITLEKVLKAVPHARYPLCIAGRRRCPPESVGGAEGYLKFLEVLEDPSHPEYDMMQDWALSDSDELSYDAEYFDVNEANDDLMNLSMPCQYQAATVSQWRALFDEALRVKALAPWEKLHDDQLIAVEVPDLHDRIYCAALGNDGACRAVALYPGDDAWLGLQQPYGAGEPAVMSGLGTQRCILCYFGNRQDLEPEDRSLLKELGITFRGRHQWIYFRSMEPGFFPWFLDADEVRLCTAALRRYIEAFQALQNGLNVDFDAGEILLCRLTEGGWTMTATPPPEPAQDMAEVKIEDDLYIARLAHTRRSRLVLEVDLLFIPTPVQEYRDQRPFFPQVLMVVDRESHSVIAHQLLEIGQYLEDVVFDTLEGIVMDNGLPQQICVRSALMCGILADWCAKLDIALSREPLMLLDEACNAMFDMLGGGWGDGE